MSSYCTEVFKEGLDFASPALFPSTVVNAASSHVSIRFNIQGFNTTISTGFTSGLESLRYAVEALENKKQQLILASGVDTLTYPLFFGFYQLGYMAGLHGEPISCPFDRRRNGPLLGEAAVVFLVENEERARARKAKIFARIRGITSFFDAFSISRIHPQGKGLEIAIREALDSAGINSGGIDYISSCANSSIDLDIIEVKVLKRIFGKRLDKIPTSSIKSMFGETISASGSLQVASCIGVMQKEMVPPTANFKEKDPECELDCVPNQAQKKNVKTALVTSFGPGGYNSACVLEKYTDN